MIDVGLKATVTMCLSVFKTYVFFDLYYPLFSFGVVIVWWWIYAGCDHT